MTQSSDTIGAAGPMRTESLRERPGAYGASRDGARRDSSVLQIVGALWRHLILLVGLGMLCAGLAAVVVKQLEPWYTASGLMVLGGRDIKITEFSPTTMNLPTEASRALSEADVLRSWSMAERVARELNLIDNPAYDPDRKSGLEALLPERWTAWLHKSDDKSPPKGSLSPEDMKWAAVIDAVRRNTIVHSYEKSYTIGIEHTARDPQLAATIVNTMMRLYIDDLKQQTTSATVEADVWLNQRLAELRRDVEEADRRVQELRSQRDVLETKAGNISALQLNQVNMELSSARGDLVRLQTSYSHSMEALRTTGSAALAPEVLASPLIQRLRERESELARDLTEAQQRLGALHPRRRSLEAEMRDIHSRIDAEAQKIVTSLASDIAVTKSRVEALEQKAEQLQSQAAGGASAEVDLNQAIKDADGKREIYQTFLNRSEQLTRRGGIDQADARIASAAATPVQPSSPRKMLTVILSGVGGMLLGAALVAGRLKLDKRFRSLRELSDITGAEPLGALAMVKARGKAPGSLPNLVVVEPHSAPAETIRAIRFNLHLALEQIRSKVVLVTSALPGEGKTTFAATLGRVAALDGQRVLLVDADFRRPAVESVLGGEPGAPYLGADGQPATGAHSVCDVLDGRVPLLDAVRMDPSSGLYYLPTLEPFRSPQKLLESRTFERLLQEAETVFDYIILDSPPVMRVPDPIVLARYCDAVLVVVAWERSPRSLVEEALKRMHASKPDTLGTVLTQVSRSTLTPEAYYAGYRHGSAHAERIART